MKKKRDTIKNPTIKIDKSLDKYNDVVLFPEKVAQAKETIKRVGLPKLKEKDK
ncbi:MAG: hypothetical protein JWQ09_1279 [Segetibacter sp.]|nr:hypothetical protein [Segetibacter sp.]